MALKNLTMPSALWCFYLDVSLGTSVFLFTIALIPSLQTSLQSVGQLRSSHNRVVHDSLAVVSGIPTGLWTTLWERLTHTYIQNKKSVDFGLVGEEKRWYRQWDDQSRPLGYALSHWFWKRVKGKEEEMLIFHRREWAPGRLSHPFSWNLPCYNWNYICLCLNDNIFHRICK